MDEDLKTAILRSGLVAPGDGILVAVSGGPDSVALLVCLNELKDRCDLRLEVAHVHHGIRGQDAADDARFVAGLAKRLDLLFHLHEADIAAQKVRAGRGNLEELGRAERYRFFASVARERRLAKIATAHTQDEQAETVLMWLLRGCGMRGSGGMAPSRILDRAREAELIRPFLEVAKTRIVEYLEERGIAWRADVTNGDPALLRNWLRHRLIPCLERRTGPGVAARLSRQAAIARDEDEYLQGLAREALHAVRRADGAVDRRAFLARPPVMQRRILRLWIEETRGDLRAIDCDHVEQSIRLIAGERPHGRLSLPAGWELAAEYGIVKLDKRSERRAEIRFSYRLDAGGRLSIPESGIEITSEYVAGKEPRLPRTLFEAACDARVLAGGLVVRNFRPGDRFQPLGTAGHKKVKELFIEKKVPLCARARVPLVLAGDHVVWIPGYARAELGRIGAATREIVRLKATVIDR